MPQKQVIPFVLSGANKAWRVLKRTVFTTYARIANSRGAHRRLIVGVIPSILAVICTCRTGDCTVEPRASRLCAVRF